jgi:hypothetical protein
MTTWIDRSNFLIHNASVCNVQYTWVWLKFDKMPIKKKPVRIQQKNTQNENVNVSVTWSELPMLFGCIVPEHLETMHFAIQSDPQYYNDTVNGTWHGRHDDEGACCGFCNTTYRNKSS